MWLSHASAICERALLWMQTKRTLVFMGKSAQLACGPRRSQGRARLSPKRHKPEGCAARASQLLTREVTNQIVRELNAYLPPSEPLRPGPRGAGTFATLRTSSRVALPRPSRASGSSRGLSGFLSPSRLGNEGFFISRESGLGAFLAGYADPDVACGVRRARRGQFLMAVGRNPMPVPSGARRKCQGDLVVAPLGEKPLAFAGCSGKVRSLHGTAG